MFKAKVQQKPEVTYIGDNNAGFQVVRFCVATTNGDVPHYANSAIDPHVTYSASLLSVGDEVMVEVCPVPDDPTNCVLDLDNYWNITKLFLSSEVVATSNWELESNIHTQFLKEIGDIGLIVGG